MTTIKERPILMSAPMVRAILEGRKTQTRRIVKPQPEWKERHNLTSEGFAWERGKESLLGWPDQDEFSKALVKFCEHGQPGDRLWVRETFAYVGSCDPGYLVFKADYPKCAEKYGFDRIPPTIEECGERWKPSIHMPRWASRITLEITGVRVERLQDISEKDAWAEGCDGLDDGGPTGGLSGYGEFADLWQSINGEDSWSKNPWVWVIQFKTLEMANG